MSDITSGQIKYYAELMEEIDAILPVLWERDDKLGFQRVYGFPQLKISSEKIEIDSENQQRWQATVILYTTKEWNADPLNVTFFISWSSPTYIMNGYTDEDMKIFSSVINKSLNAITSDNDYSFYENTWDGDGKGEFVMPIGSSVSSDAAKVVDMLEKQFSKIEAGFNRAAAAAE